MVESEGGEILEKSKQGLLSKKQIGEIIKAAESGDAKYQCCLALMYMHRTCAEGTAEEGLEWLKKSAEAGFAPAKREFGNCYLNGLPPPHS